LGLRVVGDASASSSAAAALGSSMVVAVEAKAARSYILAH
jgi:hypothetical protein